jgi:flagellar motility protein MotE (MotC chaperone)
MRGMTKHRTTERHASKTRRDHLWVLAVIAGFALYDVWGGWTQIGNKSGFTHGTGWTLTVIVEAYWGYALWAWLTVAPGIRSRRFAMWSAGGVFVLSLAGQAFAHLAAHKMPPAGVVVFVSTLPVIVLALIAILVHLRHLDRAEAVEVAEEPTSQAELSDASAALRQAEADRDTARAEAAQAATATAALQEQMAALEARLEAALKGDTEKRQPPRRSAAPKVPARTGGVTEEEKLGTEVAALAILAENPDISGSELGRRLGKTPGYGRTLVRKLASANAGGDS